MKGGKTHSRGFTVVETLVVLAVTGALFVAVAIALSGRQAQAQFDQSIQEAKSQIQQVIDDVAVGYYPNSSNFTCNANYSTGPTFAAGTTKQGENSDCIFLGKVIYFGITGSTAEQFNVYSLAGLKQVSAGGPEVTTNNDTDYSQAKPQVITASTDTKKLLYGMTTYRVWYGGTPGTPIAAIGFANSLASYSSGAIISGSQQVNVVPVKATSLGVSTAAGETAVNNQFPTSPINPAGGVYICLVSGTTKQSGLITIGGSGRQLSVTLSIKGNTTCS